MGSLRVRHDWATNTFFFFHLCSYFQCVLNLSDPVKLLIGSSTSHDLYYYFLDFFLSLPLSLLPSFSSRLLRPTLSQSPSPSVCLPLTVSSFSSGERRLIGFHSRFLSYTFLGRLLNWSHAAGLHPSLSFLNCFTPFCAALSVFLIPPLLSWLSPANW